MSIPPPHEPFLTAADRIADVARTRPDAVAVRHGAEALSYGDLTARAARLRWELHARGCKPVDRIGVCLEPEMTIPVAMFAILSFGAAYVPIDAQYPRERIREMLDELDAAAIITRRAQLDRIPAAFHSRCVVLEDVDLMHGPSLEAAPVDPSAIATVFFTSGTTGRPKGVTASHVQVAFYTDAARTRFEMREGDVVPTIARIGFSISLFELLAPLTGGATVVVLDRPTVLSVDRLAEALHGVTLFHAGPSLLRGVLPTLIRHRVEGRRNRVRHASTGGDMIPPQVLADLRAAFPDAEWFVLYGCSEISCMGTWAEVPRQGPIDRTYVGRPFSGVSLRVCDEQLAEVPHGEPGEVLFAGPGVVPGYHRRPELAAERFVTLDGQRYYRTGDIGRWHSAHGLELLGRADFQIKVRGMRVESADVEFHLRSVPGVRDAAVALRDREGGPVLAAFVVADTAARAADGSSPAELAARIRQYLADHVPDYMVPSAIVELEALPLNVNLKLDRRALPELGAFDRPMPPREEPQGEAERWMAGIWRDLLGRVSVGRYDNFFEVGGDSLLSVQLIARIERETGTAVEGIAVLRETLSALAAIARPGTAAPQTAEEAPPSTRRQGFYFGPSGSLYGSLERNSAPTAERAVLVCAPVGAEEIRTTFIIALLMRRLADAGIPAMRFDLYGSRDSAGDNADGSPARWRDDVLAARTTLIERTRARAIVGIGFRYSATLLAHTAAEATWSAMVLVDPVVRGAAFIDEQIAAETERRSRALPTLSRLFGRRDERVAGIEEILGYRWAARAVDDVRRDVLAIPATHELPRLSWLATDAGTDQSGEFARLTAGRAGAVFVSHPTANRWGDHRKVLELMPEAGIVDALVPLVTGAT